MSDILGALEGGTVKGIVEPWLRNRALVLPEATVQSLAQKFGVDESVIHAINGEIINLALSQLDTLKL